MRRADEYCATVQGHGGAEEVICRAVASDEGVELAPVAVRFGECIGFPLAGVASNRGDVGSDDRMVAIERNRVSEVIACRAVSRGELLRLAEDVVGILKM
jgi:hypothetical protein